MNINKPPPMHATSTVETLHLPKDYSFFFVVVVFAGFFGVFWIFLDIVSAVHVVCSMTAHTLVSHC